MTTLYAWHIQQIFDGRFWSSKTGTIRDSSAFRRQQIKREPLGTMPDKEQTRDPERLIRDVEQHPDAYQHEGSDAVSAAYEAAEDSIRKLTRTFPKKDQCL